MTTLTAWMSIPLVKRSVTGKTPPKRFQKHLGKSLKSRKSSANVVIHTCADQVSTQSVSEVVEHTISVFL